MVFGPENLFYRDLYIAYIIYTIYSYIVYTIYTQKLFFRNGPKNLDHPLRMAPWLGFGVFRWSKKWSSGPKFLDHGPKKQKMWAFFILFQLKFNFLLSINRGGPKNIWNFGPFFGPFFGPPFGPITDQKTKM